MPGASAWPTAYLESADSIHVDYGKLQSGDQSALLEARYRELQLFLEIVSVLAMGRNVVVPQPFAFDSYAFQKAAQRIWSVYDKTDRPDPSPIRLHLHGAQNFGAAITAILARTGPGGSFHSSNFPELNRGEWKIDPSSGAAAVLSELGEDDPRSRLLQGTLEHFRSTPRNRMARNAPSRTLGEQLESVFSHHALATGHPDLRDALRRATDELRIGSCGFNARSHLRSDGPWEWDSQGRTPREIVGDDHVLDVLIEVVDTLYNRVVAHTTGAAYGTFTTAIQRRSAELDRLGLAQQAAVETIPSSVDAGTAIDMEIRSVQPLPPAQLDALLKKVLDAPELTDGLAALLRARADRDSSFHKSLGSLQTAQGEPQEAKALDRHLDVVAGLLGEGFKTGRSDLHWAEVGLGVTAAATSAGVLVNPAPDLANALVLAAFSVGGSAISLVPALRDQARSRSFGRKTRSALAHVLKEH